MQGADNHSSHTQQPPRPAIGGRKDKKVLKDVESSAAALYDGGWRATDRDDLITEYDLTADEADAICAELDRMEPDA